MSKMSFVIDRVIGLPHGQAVHHNTTPRHQPSVFSARFSHASRRGFERQREIPTSVLKNSPACKSAMLSSFSSSAFWLNHSTMCSHVNHAVEVRRGSCGQIFPQVVGEPCYPCRFHCAGSGMVYFTRIPLLSTCNCFVHLVPSTGHREMHCVTMILHHEDSKVKKSPGSTVQKCSRSRTRQCLALVLRCAQTDETPLFDPEHVVETIRCSQFVALRLCAAYTLAVVATCVFFLDITGLVAQFLFFNSGISHCTNGQPRIQAALKEEEEFLHG